MPSWSSTTPLVYCLHIAQSGSLEDPSPLGCSFLLQYCRIANNIICTDHAGTHLFRTTVRHMRTSPHRRLLSFLDENGISTNSNEHDAYVVIRGFATKHVVRVISWYKRNMSTEISVDSSHNRRTGQHHTWAYCFLPVFYRRWHPGCGGVTSD